VSEPASNKPRTWRPVAAWTAGTVLALLVVVSFVGVYQDREFRTWHVFLKHRPTLKMHFFAPLGETDRTLSQLPENLRAEEAAFMEYVERGGGQARSICLPFQ
jgi:hypothetical protein